MRAILPTHHEGAIHENRCQRSATGRRWSFSTTNRSPRRSPYGWMRRASYLARAASPVRRSARRTSGETSRLRPCLPREVPGSGPSTSCVRSGARAGGYRPLRERRGPLPFSVPRRWGNRAKVDYGRGFARRPRAARETVKTASDLRRAVTLEVVSGRGHNVSPFVSRVSPRPESRVRGQRVAGTLSQVLSGKRENGIPDRIRTCGLRLD
jgi:hypothetical protein